MTNFVTPTPSIHKKTVDLLFKNNRIRKHVHKIKTLFRVDVINVWSLVPSKVVKLDTRVNMYVTKWPLLLVLNVSA